MFSGLNVGGDGGGSAMATEDGLLAMMEKMMGSLLSKEILYPPLKDFCQQVRLCYLNLNSKWVFGLIKFKMGLWANEMRSPAYAVS